VCVIFHFLFVLRRGLVFDERQIFLFSATLSLLSSSIWVAQVALAPSHSISLSRIAMSVDRYSRLVTSRFVLLSVCFIRLVAARSATRPPGYPRSGYSVEIVYKIQK